MMFMALMHVCCGVTESATLVSFDSAVLEPPSTRRPCQAQGSLALFLGLCASSGAHRPGARGATPCSAVADGVACVKDLAE